MELTVAKYMIDNHIMKQFPYASKMIKSGFSNERDEIQLCFFLTLYFALNFDLKSY